MKAVWCAAALGSSLLITIGCSHRPQAHVVWVPFSWVSAELGSEHLEHAALIVPATLDGFGGDHNLQLDLGAEASVLHGGAVLDLAPQFINGDVASVDVSGSIAGASVTNLPMRVIRDYRATIVRDEPLPVIGSLGLRFFEHRVLVLDYPAQRLAVVSPDQPLPDDLDRQATFVPLDYRNGKAYVPIELNGAVERRLFFDTGASAFDLVVSPEEWRQLTDRRGTEEDSLSRAGATWNKEVKLVGTPMTGTAAIGPAVQEHPFVWLAEDGVSFSAWPNTVGLFGNGLFADRFVVVVDVPHHRFGVAPHESVYGALP